MYNIFYLRTNSRKHSNLLPLNGRFPNPCYLYASLPDIQDYFLPLNARGRSIFLWCWESTEECIFLPHFTLSRRSCERRECCRKKKTFIGGLSLRFGRFCVGRNLMRSKRSTNATISQVGIYGVFRNSYIEALAFC